MLHRPQRVLLAAALCLGMALPAAAKAPNIVFILADDLDAVSTAKMPQLKTLITDQGMTFRHHYVTLSLCCPSRISGLRGQFAHNTGIYKNGPGTEGGFGGVYATGLEASTAATWLKDAGYRTGLFGKYLNGYPDDGPSATYVPPGWSEWMSPNAGTPYKGWDYTMNFNGASVAYGSTDGEYMTDVLSNQAANFIRRSVDQFPTQPFFLYVASYAPHSPALPATRHANTFKNAVVPHTASFNESDVSDKPAWVQASALLTTSQIQDLDRLYRKRLQSLLAVDEMIQNIISTLQAKGQLSNTYVFFTSDNGFHMGQHRLDSGKLTGYEEDLLIPLMVRGPGVPARQTVDIMTANVDYAPTFAEIGGGTIPSFVDGRSLLPLLNGQTPPSWRQALLLEHKFTDGAPLNNAKSLLEPSDALERIINQGAGITGFTGLRLADGTTYIEYESGEFELYDNNADPAQLTNIYNAASSETKARLTSWTAALKTASGAALRDAELAAP